MVLFQVLEEQQCQAKFLLVQLIFVWNGGPNPCHFIKTLPVLSKTAFSYKERWAYGFKSKDLYLADYCYLL